MIQDYPTTNALKELRRFLTPRERAEMDALLTMRQPQAEAAQTAEPAQTWQPLDWQRKVIDDRSLILLLTGSKGGGKSDVAAHKVHQYCQANEGVTCLALRKTRESMTNSTVLFLDREIIRDTAKLKSYQHRFEYPNGSILAYGGMKDREQREQVRSIGQRGGIAMLWLEEANAFDEEDFNEVFPTLRQANAPYRQAILTTNPDSPMHWIYRRMIQGGEATVIYSGAKDNPYNPADYESAVLSKITGAQRQRLVLGQWSQASGAVYQDVWDEADGSVTDAAEYEPNAGVVFWACDDGYSPGSEPPSGRDKHTGYFVADAHPRVFLRCQLKADGHLDVFSESYACSRLTDEHIAEILQENYPRPEVVAHGPGSAEFRGRLMASGLMPNQVTEKVETTISELRSWLAKDVNGFRRIRVHPRCKHLRAEMVSYAYDPQTQKPVKAFDHGCDALRYLVWTLRLHR